MSQFPGNNSEIESLIERGVSRVIDAMDRRERERLNETGTNSQSRDSDVREIRNDVEEIRNLLAQAVGLLGQINQSQQEGGF